LGSRNMSE